MPHGIVHYHHINRLYINLGQASQLSMQPGDVYISNDKICAEPARMLFDLLLDKAMDTTKPGQAYERFKMQSTAN